MPLTLQTAGESHGPAVIALVNGLPAGLVLNEAFINAELRRRQGGYGRGARQKIEHDAVNFISGVRRIDESSEKALAAEIVPADSVGMSGTVNARFRTIGSPLTLKIDNRDHRLDEPQRTPALQCPRPGHADLAGALKFLTNDCRDVLERASARETAARVAAGAVARCLLREVGIETFGMVRGMLDCAASTVIDGAHLDALRAARDASEVYCPDQAASEAMIRHIRRAKEDGDTVGGLCEVHVFNCPPGLGTCANWDERLDARLAAAVMSIPAFKAVEIGLGKDCAARRGSAVHDPIHYDPAQREKPAAGFTRPSNHAGGIEGGMSNGMPIVVRGAMKPISTLLQGMPSVDLRTMTTARSDYERSDVCALPAASVVIEHVVAFEIARAFLQKFSGDTMREVAAAFAAHQAMLRETFAPKSHVERG